MTPEEFKKFKALTQDEQINLFVKARKNLNMSQTDLGDRLEIYGYAGGRRTVQSWEHGKANIPPLVYDLILNNFKSLGG